MKRDDTAPAWMAQPARSISQLRAFAACPRRFALHYLQGVPQRGMGASVWFGSLMGRILQRAYYGMALFDAHQQVWQQSCAPVYEALEEWYALDVACRAAGGPTSNARKAWLQANQRYGELAEALQEYQERSLADWTWGRQHPLSYYFRWSLHFTQVVPRERACLPHAALVEGKLLYGPEGDLLLPRFDSGPERAPAQLLHGQIGGAHVVGIPDVVAIDPLGTVWVADNKVTSTQLSGPELGEDLQLATYVELLGQNGWIEPGQTVRVGHLYLLEQEVVAVWGDTARYEEEVLPALSWWFARLEEAIAAGEFPRMRGMQYASMGPCRACGVAHACPEPLYAARQSPAG